MTAHTKLAVGVLLPTRNAMKLLPAHWETMQPWLPLVEEIVVVDSDSQDGTVEFLREKLAGHPVRFFHRPPGIYDCWNFGLQQLRSRYAYISTVGDGITREGLTAHVQIAEQLTADVVVSPPELVDATGTPSGRNEWPVHRLVGNLGLTQPTAYDGLLPFAFAMAYFPFAILGSSASNLYRTSVLQQKPFPTEFGWNGDGAWGLLHALNVRLVLSPARVSFFRQHARNFPREIYYVTNAEDRLCTQTLAEFEKTVAGSPALQAQVKRFNLDRFLRRVVEVHLLRSELMRLRKRWRWFWVLLPRAWQVRRQRNLGRRECEHQLIALARQLATST